MKRIPHVDGAAERPNVLFPSRAQYSVCRPDLLKRTTPYD